jgi:hypothetical protein
MAPLGLAVAGHIADQFGVSTWFLVGGALTTAMGATAFFVPALMQIEEQHTESPVSAMPKPDPIRPDVTGES